MRLSVIICTHNPRDAYLHRTLDSLAAQSLPGTAWELLVVDNASAEPLAGRVDLGWHPNARHVREDALGLTPARLRGIAEARAELLLFVDDDNVLALDYLEQALAIGDSHPFLGAWGAGVLRPEFEAHPEPWAEPHLMQLALREHDRDHWSNDPSDWPATPVGAGLCIRAPIARRYRDDVLADPVRAALDRRGTSLDGAGDLDLAYTARHFGLGWGTFTRLSMLHLIPAGRTTRDYLLRITEAAHASIVVLGTKVGRPVEQPERGIKHVVRGALALARGGRVALQFYRAKQRGVARGNKAASRHAGNISTQG